MDGALTVPERISVLEDAVERAQWEAGVVSLQMLEAALQPNSPRFADIKIRHAALLKTAKEGREEIGRLEVERA